MTTQERVLQYVKDNPAATVRRVAKAVGIALGTTHRHLSRLQNQGLLKRAACTRCGAEGWQGVER
jgi:DNA-binding IclR family transcriptional regulator